MRIADRLAEDVSAYVDELIEENDLDYVNEELVQIIFNNYVYALAKTRIHHLILAFVIIVFGLYVALTETILLPKWVKFLTGYIMIFQCMPTGVWALGEHAVDRFAKKTIPEIFEENKSLWKFKGNKKQ